MGDWVKPPVFGGGGGGGPATQLATSALPVTVNTTAPLANQVLVSTSATNATWQYPFLFGIAFNAPLTAQNASASGVNSFAIGTGSPSASGDYSLVVGHSSAADGVGAVGLGFGMGAIGAGSIIIGRSSYGDVGAIDSVVIGRLAFTLLQDVIVLGLRAEVAQLATKTIVIGSDARIGIGGIGQADGAIVMGDSAFLSGSGLATGAIIIGNNSACSFSTDTAAEVTLLGSGIQLSTASASASLLRVVALGPAHTISSTGGDLNQSTIVGSGNTLTVDSAFGARTVLVGSGLSVVSDSVASDRNVLVGYDVSLTGGSEENIVIGGDTTIVSSDTCYVIGETNSVTSANDTLIFGRNITVPTNVTGTIDIGRSFSNNTANSFKLGTGATPMRMILSTGLVIAPLQTTDVDSTLGNFTLTPAMISGGLIDITGGASINMNWPTGATLDAYAGWSGDLFVGMSFEYIVNVRSGTVTPVAATGNTTAFGAINAISGFTRRYRLRRTGVNTWITYRL